MKPDRVIDPNGGMVVNLENKQLYFCWKIVCLICFNAFNVFLPFFFTLLHWFCVGLCNIIMLPF